ncbi:hypothetical protein GCM10027275_00730 [Rhabdobacter roseus]|uniref:PD-(D/E)XK endonuclease-like domain-containing protein n=1 Tax=Rhabdobacter roseus TaxID=1655419 RepID=A0A840TJI2_9BACT|nr:hypothetical protein [Rhabdobacter roseus]MBB5281957.1 hypothetical protein [Rhabdobacter roseus]
MEIRYKFYPTLLNTFARYQRGYLSEQELLDRINRVPIPQTEAQARGVSFEEAVIKGTDEEYFDPEVLRKARALLPRPMVETQVYCQYQLGEVLLYGYVDVIGRTLAVDLKTTSRYAPDRFTHNHQNFYLLALRPKGIRTLRYVITDFREVYQEDYTLDMDFSVQEKQIEAFCYFLEVHRDQITDAKVFGGNK